MTRHEQREQAFIFIFERTFNDESVEQIIETAMLARDIEISEYAKKVANGVNDNIDRIDGIIESHTKSWKKSRISKVSIALLRLAIFEIIFEDNIPISVSINEAVELAKEFATTEDASFINGILGTISKGSWEK